MREQATEILGGMLASRPAREICDEPARRAVDHLLGACHTVQVFRIRIGRTRITPVPAPRSHTLPECCPAARNCVAVVCTLSRQCSHHHPSGAARVCSRVIVLFTVECAVGGRSTINSACGMHAGRVPRRSLRVSAGRHGARLATGAGGARGVDILRITHEGNHIGLCEMWYGIVHFSPAKLVQNVATFRLTSKRTSTKNCPRHGQKLHG